jgi:hypothetical protein
MWGCWWSGVRLVGSLFTCRFDGDKLSPVEGDKGRVSTTVLELIRWGTILLGLTAAHQEQFAVALIAGLVLLLQTLMESKDPRSTRKARATAIGPAERKGTGFGTEALPSGFVMVKK